MASMFIVKTIEMSKVLKIHSTICELLRTMDTDLIGFLLDVIVPKYGQSFVAATHSPIIIHKQQVCDLT
jgi:hypothetical protein